MIEIWAAFCGMQALVVRHHMRRAEIPLKNRNCSQRAAIARAQLVLVLLRIKKKKIEQQI